MVAPRTITDIKSSVDNIDFTGPKKALVKNMVIIAIRVGNLPLQGTKLLVSMAISLSLGESIILQPIIPAALQPKPIHIVKACFPQAQLFLKKLSKLKAILGRYPKSSKSVKSGKKIAIGGNITDKTQAKVLYIPFTKSPSTQEGKPKDKRSMLSFFSRKKRPLARSSEG